MTEKAENAKTKKQKKLVLRSGAFEIGDVKISRQSRRETRYLEGDPKALGDVRHRITVGGQSKDVEGPILAEDLPAFAVAFAQRAQGCHPFTGRHVPAFAIFEE